MTNCITKFCEMVKNWDLTRKHKFFVDLTHNLRENKSSIPSLRLFKGLIKDQRDRQYYSSNIRTTNGYNNQYNSYNSYGGANYNYVNYGNTGYNNSNGSNQQGATPAVQTAAQDKDAVEVTQELTL